MYIPVLKLYYTNEISPAIFLLETVEKMDQYQFLAAYYGHNFQNFLTKFFVGVAMNT